MVMILRMIDARRPSSRKSKKEKIAGAVADAV
jgi:hypothetical protein